MQGTGRSGAGCGVGTRAWFRAGSTAGFRVGSSQSQALLVLDPSLLRRPASIIGLICVRYKVDFG